MIQKNKVCQGSCSRLTKIYAKNMCKSCYLKENPPKKIAKQSAAGRIKAGIDKLKMIRLHQFFLYLWDKQEDENGYCYCYETGKSMCRSIYRENSCVYSHCFPKSTYQQYAENEDNILICLPEIHAQWEVNREKTPKMLEYFNQLKEKYENG